tara:strand:- start:376 stop:591 length:216 start_codon:yes stop_codon:yes gene_type:complete
MLGDGGLTGVEGYPTTEGIVYIGTSFCVLPTLIEEEPLSRIIVSGEWKSAMTDLDVSIEMSLNRSNLHVDI